MSNIYTSLSEMRNYLNIQDTVSSSNDALLTTFLIASTKKINDYVGYSFEVEYGIQDNRLNQRDRDVFILNKWPVVGISSIESGVDYQLDSEAGIIYLDTPFTGDFELSYSAGQNPPEQVKLVCMELTALSWMRRKSIGLSQMSMGDFQFSIREFDKEIDSILRTLDDFRDTRIVHRSFINQLF